MVLNDLGRRINAAFSDLGRTPTVDDAAVDSLLQSVAGALLESDVNVRYVASLRDRVRNDVKEALNGKGAANQSEGQRKNAVQRAVFNELVRLVDPGGAPAFKPTKGKSGVIMFVGLQGSGKTTSCTKLALWYQKRGFKAGLVCADTFRAGAFDQLKQNAAKARIPFYGSYTETDPVAIAEAGVKSFKKARFDVIIVDTSGRHKQEQELFKEMIQIGEVTKPDQTIMVLDASIGQAAEAQSKAFKQAAGYGAILVTKLDGHAKGGGAISAVAATGTPIVFIGTGEHVSDLEPFRAGPFVSKMLGMGDVAGLMDKMQEVTMANPERHQQMMKKISEGGAFTIRDWREQMSGIMSMGPLSKLAGMIPGMGAMLGGADGEDEAGGRLKKSMYIMDSMTTEELDSDGHMFYEPVKLRKRKAQEEGVAVKDEKGKAVSKGAGDDKKDKKKKVPVKMTARALRVAKGSGTSLRDVEEFLTQYRMVARMAKKVGGKNSWMRKMQEASKGGVPRPGSMPLPPGMSREQVMQMQNSLPPEIKAQLRQPGGREKLLKQLQSGDCPPELAGAMGGMGMPGMGGMPGLGGLGALGNMFGGGGGSGGGMPDMGQMQQMMQQMGGMGGMANMMRNMMGGGQ